MRKGLQEEEEENGCSPELYRIKVILGDFSIRLAAQDSTQRVTLSSTGTPSCSENCSLVAEPAEK